MQWPWLGQGEAVTSPENYLGNNAATIASPTNVTAAKATISLIERRISKSPTPPRI